MGGLSFCILEIERLDRSGYGQWLLPIGSPPDAHNKNLYAAPPGRVYKLNYTDCFSLRCGRKDPLF